MSVSLARPIVITYYTDPLCAWSWAFEPVWRRVLAEHAPLLDWRYRLGGMIPEWSRYGDPLNDIAAPSHMGPHWFEISRTTGVMLDSRIWHEDPPASSHPACVAVKAAGLQGAPVGDAYLRRVREAVMLERRNVAHRSVLLDLAEEVATTSEATSASGNLLEVPRFVQALDDGSALTAFRDDLREARYREIGRFPTITLERAGSRGILMVGYRPYEVVRRALSVLAPELDLADTDGAATLS